MRGTVNQEIFENAYANYFNNKDVKSDNCTSAIIPQHQHELPSRPRTRMNGVTDPMPSAEDVHRLADSHVDSLEMACELLKRLVTAAWGTDWGHLTVEAPSGNDVNDVQLPCIAIDMNSRQVQDKSSPKPTKIGSIPEVINGIETGDHFEVYRMKYDCILEFNFYGRNMLEARRLMTRFESLIHSAVGVLKQNGISEIFFLEEVSPTLSVNYVKKLPMRCTMYYYRFERDYVVRASSLNRVQMEFGTLGTCTLEKETDVFNDPNITYNL